MKVYMVFIQNVAELVDIANMCSEKIEFWTWNQWRMSHYGLVYGRIWALGHLGRSTKMQ
jgi:hypothetical protein